MELKRGQIVLVRAGRDAGSLQAVLGREGDRILTADGDRRRIAQPKRRNPLHVWKTEAVLPEAVLSEDASLRRAIRAAKLPQRERPESRRQQPPQDGSFLCQSKT